MIKTHLLQSINAFAWVEKLHEFLTNIFEHANENFIKKYFSYVTLRSVLIVNSRDDSRLVSLIMRVLLFLSLNPTRKFQISAGFFEECHYLRTDI